ncbi:MULTISPECIES: glycosyltransferase [unclassified Halomonas]|uniref:glycosyltransferase n=1 Tax=unclassified Halomonas TaxID=2609666 RepID=UPI002076B929|nr:MULTISPECIES: glycosyltransferase [unclassified Halomonas]
MFFSWPKEVLSRTAGSVTRQRPADQCADASSETFDAQWYLAAYPDVAAAGVDPWEHFQHHGKREGRLGQRNMALAWELALWRGAHAVVRPKLERLLTDPSSNVQERLCARWALSQWAGWQGKWPAALELLAPKGRFLAYEHPGPALWVIDIVCRQLPLKRYAKLARQAMSFLHARFPDHPDTPLAEANLALFVHAGEGSRLTTINRCFKINGLRSLTRADSVQPLGLDNLATEDRASSRSAFSCLRLPLAHDTTFTPLGTPNDSCTPLLVSRRAPLVSVIVPLYNAQHTVATALASLFAQVGVRLDIIVVDDASSDESARVVTRFQHRTPDHITLRLIRHTVNQGAYAARNTGLLEARGELITTHDSDDWSHPQKLLLQSQALSCHPRAKACLSHWVRVTPTLLFHRWRLDEFGWVYPNMSSLMFRRDVFETLGYWDNVSVNADTEYRQRIEAAYGKLALKDVLPGVPLSFGRADEGSLSQHQRSHLASQFTGIRFDYMQAARHWHETNDSLYMAMAPSQRSFRAPSVLLRSTSPPNPPLDGYEALLESSMFDAGWYLERYIDLQQVTIEPFRHFWEVGAFEGRDPGPHFSTTGYLRGLSCALPAGLNPLQHYLQGAACEERALPVWPGECTFDARPTVLLCGHQAGSTLFGAERSLLDVLDAMRTLRWNVVVTLPQASNLAYEQALLKRCKALAILPYGWWQVGRLAVEATVGHFQALIRRFGVSAVHGNTAVLQEPYVAARREGISALVHVRELPVHDRSLCEQLGAQPAELVAHVHEHADIIVANSRFTARAFKPRGGRRLQAPAVRVVPNTIDMTALLALPESIVDGPRRFRVGMLSSNVAKKGLEDVEVMAWRLQTLAPDVEVVLYGPATSLIESLQKRQSIGQAPANIRYAGYVETPDEALSQLDIVMNLSRFQESFGRTVLEAMAAGKPVVAYRWGAIPELVVNRETGFLVPVGNARAVARKLAFLSRSPERCLHMGRAGRSRAVKLYSAERLKSALFDSYARSTLSELPF